MWVPFLRSFPGDEPHKLLGGGQKVYVETVYVLFLSPIIVFKFNLFKLELGFQHGYITKLLRINHLMLRREGTCLSQTSCCDRMRSDTTGPLSAGIRSKCL